MAREAAKLRSPRFLEVAVELRNGKLDWNLR